VIPTLIVRHHTRSYAAAVGVYTYVNADPVPFRSEIDPLTTIPLELTKTCSNRCSKSAIAAHSERRVSPSVFDVLIVTTHLTAITPPPPSHTAHNH
jgi:hypothetical protein